MQIIFSLIKNSLIKGKNKKTTQIQLFELTFLIQFLL